MLNLVETGEESGKVYLYFSGSHEDGLLYCFKLSFLLNSDMDLHGKSPAIRSAQIQIELRYSNMRNFTSGALPWNSSQFGFFSLISRLSAQMGVNVCPCCPS